MEEIWEIVKMVGRLLLVFFVMLVVHIIWPYFVFDSVVYDNRYGATTFSPRSEWDVLVGAHCYRYGINDGDQLIELARGSSQAIELEADIFPHYHAVIVFRDGRSLGLAEYPCGYAAIVNRKEVYCGTDLYNEIQTELHRKIHAVGPTMNPLLPTDCVSFGDSSFNMEVMDPKDQRELLESLLR